MVQSEHTLRQRVNIYQQIKKEISKQWLFSIIHIRTGERCIRSLCFALQSIYKVNGRLLQHFKIN